VKAGCVAEESGAGITAHVDRPLERFCSFGSQFSQRQDDALSAPWQPATRAGRRLPEAWPGLSPTLPMCSSQSMNAKMSPAEKIVGGLARCRLSNIRKVDQHDPGVSRKAAQIE
jgi:hypothetical protein